VFVDATVGLPLIVAAVLERLDKKGSKTTRVKNAVAKK
jgi:deoxyhypusine synthase